MAGRVPRRHRGLRDGRADRVVVDRDVTVRPPSPSFRYSSFCDVSGDQSDSFMVAVFHRDSDAAVIDALLEIRELLQSQSRDQTRARPPEALSPQRDHRGQVRGRLGGRRLRELRDHVQALGARPLRDLRRGPPSLLTSARARLLVVRLFNKANCLTRRGCHPPGTHDDLCNTAPAAMVITTTNRWVVVTDDVIARAKQPPLSSLGSPLRNLASALRVPMQTSTGNAAPGQRPPPVAASSTRNSQ